MTTTFSPETPLRSDTAGAAVVNAAIDSAVADRAHALERLRRVATDMAYGLGIPFYICETDGGLTVLQRPPSAGAALETISPPPRSGAAMP